MANQNGGGGGDEMLPQTGKFKISKASKAKEIKQKNNIHKTKAQNIRQANEHWKRIKSLILLRNVNKLMEYRMCNYGHIYIFKIYKILL